MGGEYEFDFMDSKDWDLKAYQKFLIGIREKYSSSVVGDDLFVQGKDPNPSDNVFARFHFQCRRHEHWKSPDHGQWFLRWDPSINTPVDDIHGRCDYDNPIQFKTIHNELKKKFPRSFHIYDDDLEDMIQDYNDYQEEPQDFTACDSVIVADVITIRVRVRVLVLFAKEDVVTCMQNTLSFFKALTSQ
ncbi:hypothetical protein DFA_02909 [Cavenderia fasciculata]|uniref:Uncharacterized protein n=1 Tax=Cavenderia fasciculata TaxID=261658 RepID=F4PIT6_CACFS|nr:uncharacterized protein DFA_02909 [Cavenderia fasciculata]EGG24665.1 hypothetical protein DFA_02909 [Cavenderia fasciculata]|eukprot:XP_004362516.1 hypothetical protein DFA_02909 [Cavenderia fasciculata]